jgi:hypothetical protein
MVSSNTTQMHIYVKITIYRSLGKLMIEINKRNRRGSVIGVGFSLRSSGNPSYVTRGLDGFLRTSSLVELPTVMKTK